MQRAICFGRYRGVLCCRHSLFLLLSIGSVQKAPLELGFGRHLTLAPGLAVGDTPILMICDFAVGVAAANTPLAVRDGGEAGED